MQKLVDARRAQPHCYCDLPYRQASSVCHSDGDVSLRFSRFEPVRHEAEAIAYGSPPLDTLARLFRSGHRPQVAKRRRLCLQNWTPYRRILRHSYSRAELRSTIHAATNKSESFNDFVQWLAFGGSVITENDRAEQRKIIKYNHLLANCLIFHNVCMMTRVLQKLRADGVPVEADTVAALSPTSGHI